MNSLNDTRLEYAFRLIDAANMEDPVQEAWNGDTFPRALLYGWRMTEVLTQFAPRATVCQQLAARAQHLGRWKVPRESFPATREGYLAWRSHLYGFHADEAASLLTTVGFGEDTIAAVRKMIGKQGIKRDPDVQLIEDVACLVFLRYYLADFVAAAPQTQDKLIGIVRKTWNKMSEQGREVALTLPLPDDLKVVVAAALGPSSNAAAGG